MNTVGTILKQRRIEKGLTIASVAEATKIQQKFLTAIEADEFFVLPSLAYAKGFVKNYAEFLGLSPVTVLAFFRRQSEEPGRSTTIAPRGMTRPLNAPFFQLTPGKFLALILAVLVGLFLLYFGGQYLSLRQPPHLTIEIPKDKAIVSEKRIDVVGKTDPDATVTVNNVTVLLRGDGQFFDQVSLEPGINKITVVATSRFGKATTTILEVGLQTP